MTTYIYDIKYITHLSTTFLYNHEEHPMLNDQHWMERIMS
jgi:hypothetical protein